MRHSWMYWIWALWILWFVVWESVGIYHEFRSHPHTDEWTFTHFVASQVPLSLRVAFLAWLVYHFLWQHIHG